jgi:threonine dehydratase
VAARTASPLNLRKIAAFGADIRLDGEDIEDARLLACDIAEASGAYLVEDSLDLATCEGATIGPELVRDAPGLDVVLVAIASGAIASGVAAPNRAHFASADRGQAAGRTGAGLAHLRPGDPNRAESQ